MTTTSKSENHDGLKIINAGLFRMATKSMARAYQILGFKTHHGLLEDVLVHPWTVIEQAAEATWPEVRSRGSPKRAPFQRSDWDALWGAKYDAVTDLASPFARELIRTYPNAKVVIVQRDFDSWWASFKPELLDRVMVQPMATIAGWICWYGVGIRAVHAMRKVNFGFFGARTPEEVELHARDAYEGYYSKIREMVPEERRLEYKMGDGWEPLCKFLEVDVPIGVPFPRENDRAEHVVASDKRARRLLLILAKMSAPCVVGLAAAVGSWAYLR